MARYVFDPFVVFKGREKADPDKIGNELDTIASANKGRLQPADVVTSARRRTSPLHPYFEWSDKVAAEHYRLDQARTLIRSVRIVAVEDEPPRHAFHSITDREGTAYRTVGEILRNADLQRLLERQAQRELLAFERRFRELSDVCELVREARERLEERIRTASPPTQPESRPTT